MIRLLPGRPHPLGATYDGHGANFAVHSEVAEAVAVCITQTDGTETAHWLPMRDGSIHHGYLAGVAPATRYGLRVEGPWLPSAGSWCNSAKLLIDPYANAVDGDIVWDRAVYGYDIQDPDAPEPHDSAPFMPRSLVVDHGFDWGGDAPPRIPWHETLIYETHVKCLTQLHPDVPPELRGTYRGLASPPVIEHLLTLGVTTVELLPVQQFVHDHALVRHGLHNLWGYQPIGFFAPHHGYAASPEPGGQVAEFKEMVRTLHAAGLEVILDVVYNHTGESHHLGPNLSFRGIDNAAYYRLSDEDPRHYLDFSGVGNTINTDHPAVLRMIADSLRLWVERYHVDGFRFDLATTLARSGIGFDTAAPFLQLMFQDPILNNVKLIAEPWDVGPGGYRLGAFPAVWREWNDRYRDTARDYWRGVAAAGPDLALRLTGSADIFARGGRRPPTTSINFVTSHDGYTLADLVSYERKHNTANGHHNDDGHNDNRSWNTGVEGESDDGAIVELRNRRRRSILATLLLSQGVPMLLGGDELTRTQRGNNNAYAQDNEVSWYDWAGADPTFLDFARTMVHLRRRHPVFSRRTWLRDTPADRAGLEDIRWFSPDAQVMRPSDWEASTPMAVAVYLNGEGLVVPDADGTVPVDDSFLLMLNPSPGPLTFVVPKEIGEAEWRLVVDTALPGAASTEPAPLGEGDPIDVAGFGLVVLRQVRSAT